MALYSTRRYGSASSKATRVWGAMAGSRGTQQDRILSGAALAFVVLMLFAFRDSVELAQAYKIMLVGAFLIGGVVAFALVALHVWNRPTTPTALELSERFEEVRFMSGAQFEVFVADLFEAMGHQTMVLGGAGDQGVDVLVNPRGKRIAVQCKNYSKPVGNKAVQEVYAGARHHRCVEAWVVAPAGYTSGAIALARSTDVSLCDSDSLHQWIMKVDNLEKARASETESEPIHPPPENTPINEVITDARKWAIWHPHPDDPPKD
jgi:restriction system protein